ncbi:hypothetical protein OU748_004327 [Yersinia enterocolitica]|nr:hypothetical protein [Yersinia enterocolitica]EKN3797942.1 hypothetical protein [Yersinia enterocolitica]EKN4176555.1 hypothetical protein [Yersinia enterocolitica]ELY5229949.1 hypothetical protein [Yersinia enterocolitica]
MQQARDRYHFQSSRPASIASSGLDRVLTDLDALVQVRGEVGAAPEIIFGLLDAVRLKNYHVADPSAVCVPESAGQPDVQ